MKQKYFIRGLGVGILCTAILFSIPALWNSITGRTSEQPGQSATEAPVSQVTKESKEPDASQVPSAEPSEELPVQSPQPVSETAAPSLSPQQTGNTGATVSGGTDGQPQDGQEQTKTITVTEGMTSGEVSEQLEKEGLVQDAQEFNTYLVNRGYSEEIHAGSFEISTTATYEQIANTISSKQK